MRVLLLGPHRPSIEECIRAAGDSVVRTEERIDRHHPVLNDVDFVVSYGYRYIIPADVLQLFGAAAVNLHISLLPWNRGADPNLWSYLEDTPKGVTVHVLYPDLDTGPVIVQAVVPESPGDTLKTSYARLSARLEDLFCEAWPDLRDGRLEPRPQRGAGSVHCSADKAPYEHLLVDGWDTLVSGLVGKARAEGPHGTP